MICLKHHASKDWLSQKYCKEELSLTQISKLCGCDRMNIYYWIKKFDIPRRTIGESNSIIRNKKYENSLYRNIGWLYLMYHEFKYSPEEIANICNTSAGPIRRWLKIFQIPLRTQSESAKLAQPKVRDLKSWRQRIFGKGRGHPQYGRRGPFSHNWKEETELYKKIRGLHEFKKLKEKRKELDGYQCQFCNFNQELHVDHIKPLIKILIENSVCDYEEVLQCNELFDINNLRTLCASCHRKTSSYGKKREEYC